MIKEWHAAQKTLPLCVEAGKCWVHDLGTTSTICGKKCKSLVHQKERNNTSRIILHPYISEQADRTAVNNVRLPTIVRMC